MKLTTNSIEQVTVKSLEIKMSALWIYIVIN